ncbi:uncharacterized protein [Clytia hemisphaerica]|uniref:Cnidarian restricted protein n=1 Tax=Clytia hemisphaerica TaxID=252671 RepID=A0A7M5XEV0_9CNID
MRERWLLTLFIIVTFVTGSQEENKKKKSGLQIESIEYKTLIPKDSNAGFSQDDDIMTGASTASISPSKPTVSVNVEDDAVDLMSPRSKREVDYPSFDDIYSYIHHPSSELFDELTATATVTDPVSDGGDDGAPSPHAGAGMKGIMNELKASKHHKLTRNDIRQLAKKAVILATLKKLKDSKTGTAKSSTPAKPSPITTPKSSKKHKKGKKSKKKHHSEKHTHISESTTPSITSTTSSKDNEMSEDLSKASTNHQDALNDDSSATSSPVNADLLPNNDAVDISKKSNIGKIDDSVANMFEDADSTKTPTEKSTSTGRTQLTEKVKSLRSFLVKADPAVIPLKFLPDLPSGLRMIGWKEMIDKKKKQLNELEATVGAVDDATETKPVSLNIDVEDQIPSKTAAAAAEESDLTELTGDKKSSDPISLQHIGYLQRHIKGARSLRKLIAKTLVGHCKSTGKRIFDAFVAMDKALARAQTIATVIGKKFNIDIDRIDALVGDKEDQVVETFLKDIFTKI